MQLVGQKLKHLAYHVKILPFDHENIEIAENGLQSRMLLAKF